MVSLQQARVATPRAPTGAPLSLCSRVRGALPRQYASSVRRGRLDLLASGWPGLLSADAGLHRRVICGGLASGISPRPRVVGLLVCRGGRERCCAAGTARLGGGPGTVRRLRRIPVQNIRYVRLGDHLRHRGLVLGAPRGRRCIPCWWPGPVPNDDRARTAGWLRYVNAPARAEPVSQVHGCARAFAKSRHGLKAERAQWRTVASPWANLRAA